MSLMVCGARDEWRHACAFRYRKRRFDGSSASVAWQVLSPTTTSTERITKNEEYRATPSILHYATLEQTARAATMFSRIDDDWVCHVHTKAAILAFQEIGVVLPLALLYEGMTFREDQ